MTIFCIIFFSFPFFYATCLFFVHAFQKAPYDDSYVCFIIAIVAIGCFCQKEGEGRKRKMGGGMLQRVYYLKNKKRFRDKNFQIANLSYVIWLNAFCLKTVQITIHENDISIYAIVTKKGGLDRGVKMLKTVSRL